MLGLLLHVRAKILTTEDDFRIGHIPKMSEKDEENHVGLRSDVKSEADTDLDFR